ncbi:MAG: HDOD domain-containing protein, partial [Deltaproteobacteria bacterium]|nr:HDOD domain-containing protein [Deltaproteobacteria bacterium]
KILRTQVGSHQTKIDEVVLTALQDPVLVLHIFSKISKNPELATTGTDLKLLVLRLGFGELRSLVDSLLEKHVDLAPEIDFLYQRKILKLVRIGVVARILAEGVAKNLAEEVPALGVICNIGELLVMTKYQRDYLKVYEESTTQNFYSKFTKHFGINVQTSTIHLLKVVGVSSTISKIIDTDEPVQGDLLTLRNLVFGADELVQAFETDKLSRYSPGSILPSKSFLRLLPFSDNLYARTFERISLFLYKKVTMEPTQTTESDFDLDKLEMDLSSLLDNSGTVEPNYLESLSENSMLEFAPYPDNLKLFENVINNASDFSSLCSALLLKLVDSNLFDRSALIEVDFFSKRLILVESKGEGFQTNVFEIDKVLLNSLNRTKVKSSHISTVIDLPLGSKTYACMPLPTTDKLYLLYADTKNKPIGFDLRKTFREVSKLALKKIQQIRSL